MEDRESIFDLINRLNNAGKNDAQISNEISSYLEFKARDHLVPYVGQFELTPFCNLNCKMCYVHLNKNQTDNRGLLDVATWKNLMQQAINAGMLKAKLSGGECLTYPGFDELYLFLKSKGMLVTVLTNGVLLNHERIRFFKGIPPEKLQVSLYGSSEEVYEKVTGERSFSKVLNNILEAKEAGLPICVAITPSKYLEKDLYNIIDLVRMSGLQYSINSCLFVPRVDTGRHEKQHDMSIGSYVDLYTYQYKLENGIAPVPTENITPPQVVPGYESEGIRCGAGRSKFSINWKGIMNPCSQMESISAFPLTDGVEKAWEQITGECRKLPRFIQCKKCQYAEVCSFCFGVNEQLGSRFELNEMWCERTLKKLQRGLIKFDNC